MDNRTAPTGTATNRIAEPTVIYENGLYRAFCAFDMALYERLVALRREVGVARFRWDGEAWAFTEKALVRRVREILPSIRLVNRNAPTVLPVAYKLHPAIAHLRTLTLPFAFYPFQEEALKRIWDRDGNLILAADAGVGKTVVAAAYGTAVEGSILIVCQKVNRLQWAKAVKSIAHEEVLVLSGNGKNQRDLLRTASDYRWIVASYETCRILKEEMQSLSFGLLVVDESHFLMTQTAQRTQAIYGGRRELSAAERESLGVGWAQRYIWEPGINTARTLNLTGTPFKSKPQQMWTQLHAVDPEQWDNEEAFRQRYCAPRQITLNRGVSGYTGKQWHKNERVVTTYNGVSNADELHARIQPYVYRITFAEALPHLPPVVANDIFFELEADEQREYDRIVEDLASWLEEQPDREGETEDEKAERIARTMNAEALVRTTYLRMFMAKAKAMQAIDLIESAIESEEGALVFCSFKEPLHLIQGEMAKRKVKTMLLTGDETDKKREEAKLAFRTGEIPFLLLTFAAGGTGLDGLQDKARIVISVDEAWEPTENTQAVRRAMRNGQKDSVTHYTIIGADTVDETVHEKLDIKGDGFSRVIDGTPLAIRRNVSMVAEVLKTMRAQGRALKKKRATPRRAA